MNIITLCHFLTPFLLFTYPSALPQTSDVQVHTWNVNVNVKTRSIVVPRTTVIFNAGSDYNTPQISPDKVMEMDGVETYL